MIDFQQQVKYMFYREKFEGIKEIIPRFGKILDLSSNTISRAVSFVNDLELKTFIIRSKSKEVIAATLLYCACRQTAELRPKGQISKLLDIPYSSISRLQKELIEEKVITPTSFVI